jgi:hypothetical protein
MSDDAAAGDVRQAAADCYKDCPISFDRLAKDLSLDKGLDLGYIPI